jgi:phospholipase C
LPPPGQIQHLVVLMMENRSFDHMFGFLKSDAYPIEGLTGNESNPDGQGEPVKVSPDANYSGDLGTDPGHHFPDVNIQIFGNIEGAGAPNMSGFVIDYQKMCGGNLGKSRRIMKCFTSKRIPVITTLAQQYAICDHWFSSIPGPTLPNRSFAHAATSVGRLDMNPLWFDEGKTIYELLNDYGVSSKIYFHDMSMAQTFKNLQLGDQSKHFGRFSSFLSDCKKGTLPAYSFIEPRFNADNSGDALPASDQHPDHDVQEGETLILDVYNAVRNSPLWEKTILLIVYDEHGGTYDHVPPPATVNPDGKMCADPPFDFQRLGVRVPAVVISPWIEAGTIDSNQYDHASIVTTARKLFLGADWQSAYLTARDLAALPFDGTLTRNTARTDTVNPTQPFRRTTPAVRAARQAELPLSDFQKTQVELTQLLNQKLPADKRSPISPDSIQTQAEAAAFHQDVLSRHLPMTETAGG